MAVTYIFHKSAGVQSHLLASGVQVLNAMLLGCAGEQGEEPVQALSAALAGGAVPDTWAPNGSSVRPCSATTRAFRVNTLA